MQYTYWQYTICYNTESHLTISTQIWPEWQNLCWANFVWCYSRDFPWPLRCWWTAGSLFWGESTLWSTLREGQQLVKMKGHGAWSVNFRQLFRPNWASSVQCSTRWSSQKCSLNFKVHVQKHNIVHTLIQTAYSRLQHLCMTGRQHMFTEYMYLCLIKLFMLCHYQYNGLCCLLFEQQVCCTSTYNKHKCNTHTHHIIRVHTHSTSHTHTPSVHHITHMYTMCKYLLSSI